MADGLGSKRVICAGHTYNCTKEELAKWLGNRAQVGRLVPKGFPRMGKFRVKRTIYFIGVGILFF